METLSGKPVHHLAHGVLYVPGWTSKPGVVPLLCHVPWIQVTEARLEAFMSVDAMPEHL